MSKYDPKHFADYESFRAAEDRDRIATALERIAQAQEGMIAIAMEARGARMELSAKLQEKLKQPFEGK